MPEVSGNWRWELRKRIELDGFVDSFGGALDQPGCHQLRLGTFARSPDQDRGRGPCGDGSAHHQKYFFDHRLLLSHGKRSATLGIIAICAAPVDYFTATKTLPSPEGGIR